MVSIGPPETICSAQASHSRSVSPGSPPHSMVTSGEPARLDAHRLGCGRRASSEKTSCERCESSKCHDPSLRLNDAEVSASVPWVRRVKAVLQTTLTHEVRYPMISAAETATRSAAETATRSAAAAAST